jgi:hypothetical protein
VSEETENVPVEEQKQILTRIINNMAMQLQMIRIK